MRQSSPREILIRKVLKDVYPEHLIYWIESLYDYQFILGHFKNHNPVKLLLIHVEEFIYSEDPNKLKLARNKIAASEFWHEDSFIVTNSKIDYEEYKSLIKIQFKPGLLDLICYRPYAKNLFTIDKVKFHTAFVYRLKHPGRDITKKVLRNYTNNLSVLFYKGDLFLTNLKKDETDSVIFKNSKSAPNVYISNDRIWANQSAFVLSMENYNHGCLGIKNNAPTLSEKTYKAMHLMRPALVFGGPGSRDYLRHFGFDTWDWMIDWSFDQETDYKKSLVLYLKELKRLLETDIEELKDLLVKNRDALEYNREQVFRLIKDYKNI